MGSWVFNAAGFDYWSPELFRIYGLDPSGEAPTTDEYMALVHPEDRQFVAQTIQKTFAEGRGFDFTKRIVRPDGEIRRVRCVGVPVTLEGTFHGTGIDVTEQEHLTEELRRSEFYLAEGQRLGRAGSWSFKPDFTCDYWSRELYEILCFDPKNGIPTISSYFTRIHPEDRPVVEATIRRMIAAGEGCDLKKRIIRPDGAQRVIRCVGKAFRENGVVTRFVGTLMDITEQEELTQELRRREAYLAEAQRLSHTGSWAWSPDTDVRYWSEECHRVLGFDPRDGLPRIEELIQRVHPDDQSAFRESVSRATHGKLDEEVDYRIVHPGGAVRDIHSTGHPVFNASGELIEYTGTVIDVTERKRAEEAVRRSKAFLAEGQRLSHTGSWGWNASSGKLTWSQEHFRILGLDPEDTNPSLDVFWERVHPDDRTGLRRTFESSIQDKRDFEQEFRIVRPDSSIRHLHGVGHAVLNKANELVEFMGSTMDITERKQAEAALQEARGELERVARVTAMGELTASIAHEINQPLAGVVTSANAGLNWLAANPPNLTKTRETLERILRDGTRGGEVLARIRALLKRTPPAKILVSLNQVVCDVLALTSGELRQHGIELALNLNSNLPAILGDSIQLQQVLLNLIKNAIEAMAAIPSGQRILRIQSCFGELDGKPAVVVEVSDNGVGLSGADSSRLFEAFHTTKPQGMGMGLWISRSIIENHHGRLTASSNDGSGAAFVIMLPKASQAQA
jgi:PAS domain S-box-containing protein